MSALAIMQRQQRQAEEAQLAKEFPIPEWFLEFKGSLKQGIRRDRRFYSWTKKGPGRRHQSLTRAQCIERAKKLQEEAKAK